MPTERCDIAIIGAGAAGLMSAIWAGRTARATGAQRSIVALDGAKILGAKILVAGGGRCNVTHHSVEESAYAGSTPASIRKVLRRFDVPRTIEFFRGLGVTLKREQTGKLFPTTDDARTVLNALLAAARAAGVELRHPWRAESVERAAGGGFEIVGPTRLHADRVILCAGGRALPKTGSDGHGYTIARALGHTITDRILPALVPLTLADGCFIRALSGVTLPATIELRSASGQRLNAFTNSTLCTHFGLSGPGVLDISRYYLDRALDEPVSQGPASGAHLILNWLPGETYESLDRELQDLGKRTVRSLLRQPRRSGPGLPERVADALCREAGVDPATPGASLPREARRALARQVVETVLPVTGNRGYTHAEATAGGVPLSELRLETMESRLCPGLYLAGELCDVDGRIGGFNFQWAWSSGFVAGSAAAG